MLRSRLGSTTGEIAIEDNDLVRGRSVFRKGDAIRDDDLGQGRSVLGCDAIGDDDLSRALLGSSSLSLSLCTRAHLPLTQLFLCFSENGNLKVK